MDINHEFCDWMPYQKKYYCTVPEQPGATEKRDANTGEKLFITYTRRTLRYSLEIKDPKLHPGTPSEYEKKLVKNGGAIEFRYAVTDSVDQAKDLRNFLLHRHVAKYGNRPIGQKQTPAQCTVGRDGGCNVCVK